jgi:single-stranded-DNA-specific exonuclease
MNKRWVRAAEGDIDTTVLLAQQLNIDETLAQLLVQRGISSFDEAKDFFRPQLNHLHDPYLMKDMDKAITKIDEALENSDQLMIYGDYDVDGTTSVALVYSFFRQFTNNIQFYVPDRHSEGYGISRKGIDFAKSTGVKLIIALDCGIKSIEMVDYASELGIDFIICDHHLPGVNLPKAKAVLDPKRADCPYPFKELAGCGIGFKLAQAYSMKHDLPSETYERYTDLVMVSIAADLVPVIDENRTLAHYGLIRLNNSPCEGLRALMNLSGKPKDFTLTDVVFQLAPRINAAGRMTHAIDAVKMLLCDDQVLAEEQSAVINAQNADRKASDQHITAEALMLINDSEILINKKTTVVYNEAWNKGVIGIVASRLIEKYYRPTIVLSASNGLVTGSARSVAGFDLHEALVKCEDLMVQFGGHQFAAGLTLRPENVERFAERFEEVVASSITEELLTPEINIDAEIHFNQITGKFQRIVAQMAPFGPGNTAPVFVTHQVYLSGRPNVVGEKHLKFSLKQLNSTNFECIGFGLAEFEKLLQPNMPFSVCYTIEENVWREQKTLQLNIRAIKLDN